MAGQDGVCCQVGFDNRARSLRRNGRPLIGPEDTRPAAFAADSYFCRYRINRLVSSVYQKPLSW